MGRRSYVASVAVVLAVQAILFGVVFLLTPATVWASPTLTTIRGIAPIPVWGGFFLLAGLVTLTGVLLRPLRFVASRALLAACAAEVCWGATILGAAKQAHYAGLVSVSLWCANAAVSYLTSQALEAAPC